MSDTWFTSDLHIWHANVIKYCNRPFSTVEEMNQVLLANYRAVVKPQDTVYILGDFSLAIRPVETDVHTLPGMKHLIPGNHDFCHPAHKKGKKDLAKWVKKYEDFGFESVTLHDILTMPSGEVVNLSHMPYINNEPGDHGQKFQQYRLPDDGRWLLHGHTHALWRKKGRMIDVGVDSHPEYRPYNIEEIQALMDDPRELILKGM